MKNIAYYHTYLTDDMGTWSSMFMEHMKIMQDHKLMDALDELRITAITQQDERVQAMITLTTQFPIKTRVNFISNTLADDANMLASRNDSGKNITENITFDAIWQDSQIEEMKILYFHMKGITAVENFLRKGDATKFVIYQNWRHFLNWGTLENWRILHESLRISDIAGVNYRTEPEPHFSGGYWWANSSYIKNLPNPMTNSWWNELQANTKDSWLKIAPPRFSDEYWITSGKGKVYSLFTPTKNPAFENYPRVEYENIPIGVKNITPFLTEIGD